MTALAGPGRPLAAAPLDSARFLADATALCKAPHRVSGTPEAEAAAGYVAERLRAIGIETVIVQPFFVPQMAVDAYLDVDGVRVPLHGLRANQWQAPTTGGRPIRGRTLYAGDGRPESYGPESARDRIVVLDYAQARRWRDAFAMGAKAVIFVETGATPLQVRRFESISSDFPRFYVTQADAARCGLLDSPKEATVFARSAWSRRTARNVLAWIPGTAPEFSLKAEEVMVFAAQLDTFGEVPFLVRGARGAANCAALLQLAETLHKQPPRRSVLLAFLDGEARCLAGSCALYSAIVRNAGWQTYQRTHARFIAEHEDEDAFLAQVQSALRGEQAFAPRTTFERRALDLLREEARYQTEDVQTALRALRLRTAQAAGQTGDAEAAGRQRALEEEEAAWHALRRALFKKVVVPEVEPCLAKVRESIHAALTGRREELAVLIAHRRVCRQIGDLTADKAIVLHLTLDLSDRGPRWGTAHNENVLPGGEYNNVGFYVGVFAAFSDLVARLRGEGGGLLQYMEPETVVPPAHVDEPPEQPVSPLQRIKEWLRLVEPETTRVQIGPPVFFPADILHGGQVASRFGIYGLRLATCHDALPFAGHPHDEPGRIDMAKIGLFAADCIPLIRAAASDPAFSLRPRIRPTASFQEPEWGRGRLTGNRVTMQNPSGVMGDRPARGAFLCHGGGSSVPGFDTAVRYVADQTGIFATGPLPNPRGLDSWCCALFDSAGRMDHVNSRIPELSQVKLFQCVHHTVTALAPPDFAEAQTLVLNAASDGLFRKEEFFAQETDGTVTFFVPHAARGVKLVNRFGLALLQATPEQPAGAGLAVGEPWRTPATERRTAEDLCALNEQRLDVLRARRVTNDSLDWLQGLARSALERAEAAGTTAARLAELGISRLLSRRVYAPLLAAMNDLVKAVVILLLLTIPFAYALERLLIGTPHIYRQIGWYALFFFLTFLVLYNVHPAFAVATEPIVIFLAFVIVILSSIVIFILLGRFQSEIKRVQGLEATVHTADVSRFSTVMAAVSMGISTMRRRPMRTVFTTVTVVLLTFSILSFASFDAQQGLLRRSVGAAQTRRCLFVHHALWQAVPEQLGDLVRHMAREAGVVTERRWVAARSAAEAETFNLLIVRQDGSRTAQVRALVGLANADLAGQPALKACLPATPGAEPIGPHAVFLPPALADALAVREGERVLIRGRLFTFAGKLDVEGLTRFQQIDEAPIFPVDFGDESLAMERRPQGTTTEADLREQANLQTDSAFLPYYSANQIAVIDEANARALGGSLVALSVYPAENADVEALAQRLARVSPAPVYATLSDGIYRFFFTTLFATTGATNLIIPIVLGGLIVFGTMLGSVADREKEIYSFSALGLAPAHIGMLFFAEASVYAVLGGLGGYILAQLVGRLTAWLSAVVGINVPEMNYSSTNAIFAILTVMATVLLSTVYPALRGSRSANPGVARAWALPKPDGDNWEFVFPFTVSEYDITGVISFIREHFDNFSDCSLGLFLAENTRIRAEGRSLHLESKLALAPFDLGVTQTFLLTSLPSEIEGVDEVRVVLRRLSGTRGDWQRTNRPFISDLRRQFLIWRSLPAETMEMYRRRTLEVLGRRRREEGESRHAQDTTG